MNFKLEKILFILKKEIRQKFISQKKITINHLSFNSRELKKNSLFLCLNGEKNRGVNFVYQAFLKGVRNFVLIKKDLPTLNRILPPKKINVLVVQDVILAYGLLAKKYLQQFKGIKIAITGSIGKTSLKEILYQVLSTQYSCFKSLGNYNNHLGIPYSIFTITKDYHFFIFELGMNHPKEIKYLSEMIAPEITVITGIHPVHIGNFKNIKEIALAKSEIFLGQKKKGTIFLPEQIKQKEVILNEITKINNNKDHNLKIIWAQEDDFTIENNLSQSFNLKFTLHDNICNEKFNGTGIFFFPENLSMAFKIGDFFNLKKEKRKKVLQRINFKNISPSRMTLVNNNPLIIDDTYNANPFTMVKTIQGLMLLTSNHHLNLVIGDILELGEKTSEIYLTIVSEINHCLGKIKDKGKINFYCLADFTLSMKIIFTNLKTTHKKFFLEKTSLIKDLLPQLKKKSINYFKASRGINLQEVVKKILLNV